MGPLCIVLVVILWGPLVSAQEAGITRVVVSVLPQKTFVERVGGDHVQVVAMVRPGHNPATYHPTPRQISQLASADLYVRTGVPFEEAWMQRFRAVNPGMRVLDARDGGPLRAHEAHDHGGDSDPHVWTSPLLVEGMASRIRDELIALAPLHRRDFEENYVAFSAELVELDQEIRTLLADLSTRRFMVFHPAWGYFAEAYDLVQVAIEREGKEAGARGLAALITQATQENVKVIFVQPQFNPRAAEQVARAIGGRVESIDPLAAAYADNLRRVARLIGEANAP